MAGKSFANEILKKAGQAGKSLGGMSTVGLALDAYFVHDMYKESRDRGNNVLIAGAEAAGQQFIMSAMGMGPYMALQAATALPSLGIKAYESLATQARSMQNLSANKPFQTAVFNDSQQAYTMRQAGMKLAQASKYNVQQSMIGNEASYLHY